MKNDSATVGLRGSRRAGGRAGRLASGGAMTRLLSCDPGGVHVGLATFDNESGAWRCTRAWETDPDNGIDLIAAGLLGYHFDVLVVEEFRLYNDKAKAQTGSTMPTCELIGQIKWAHRLDCRRRKDGFEQRLREIDQNPVELVLQPASIQNPTAGVLRSRGIKSLAKSSRAEIRAAGGEGDHALSAELHAWYYILHGG